MRNENKRTKFKETELKRKNNSVSEKKFLKKLKKKFACGAIFFSGNLSPIQINLNKLGHRSELSSRY
jgi:hypothetical protein